MNNSICTDCINRNICVNKMASECDHYDKELTRSEIVNMLNDVKLENPAVIPMILNGIRKTYKINIAF